MAEGNISIDHLIHDEILNFLLNYKKSEDITFTLRRSNRFSRLDNGYWFYGNDNYLAVSFWTGMDWKNKTPNIFFKIDSEGRSGLEFTSHDSDEKAEFLDKELRSLLKGIGYRNNWRVNYPDLDYLSALEQFLTQEKKTIDKIISEKKDHYFESNKSDFNKIDFINKDEFNARLENVIKYRGNDNIGNLNKLPISLSYIKINNFGPIDQIELSRLSPYNQWIILTGLNGTGKTSFLKALTTAICRNWDNSQKINNSNFKIQIKVRTQNGLINESIDNLTPYTSNLLVRGFAAYGASRQIISANENKIDKSAIAYSIFNSDGILLDIGKQFSDWMKSRSSYYERGSMQEKIKQITELLPEIIPSLLQIKIPDEYDENGETIYIEEDENGYRYPGVIFNDLASGLKSLVAMLGDMLLRLFAQQPHIDDPSELKGIVLIDELDVHLHPSLQKKLPELLTGIFRNIQFIVTTHSPIPLLGIPSNSLIFRVDRNAKNHVSINRIKDIDIRNLLPNTILTSPIFEMDNLKPTSNINHKLINVDDDFKETSIINSMDDKIDQLFINNKWVDSKYFKK